MSGGTYQRLVIASLIALTGCLTTEEELAMTTASGPFSIETDFTWANALTNQKIINTGRLITAVSIGGDSAIDQVYLYPDGREQAENRVLLGVKNPWRGHIPSGRYSLRPVDVAVDSASVNTNAGIQVVTYFDTDPVEIPTRRDTYRRQFATGAGASGTFSRNYIVRGREWIGYAWNLAADATVGNRVLTLTGRAYTDTFDSLTEVIQTVTVTAGNTSTVIARVDNEWDDVTLTLTTTGGLHNLTGRFIAEDY